MSAADGLPVLLSSGCAEAHPHKDQPGVGQGSGLKLRVPIFDWDDNIVHMPTKIWMEDASGNAVGLSPAEFAIRRGDGDLRFPGDASLAFREFRDETGDFEGDLRQAMLGPGWRGPAFEDFKQAVIRARFFAVVTAREHSEDILRRGSRCLIENILSDDERQQMHCNWNEFRKSILKLPACSEDPLTDYLTTCQFYAVNNADFKKQHGLATSEERKKHAVRMFVKHSVATCGSGLSVEDQAVSSVSFGMSDDDPQNVAAIETFMRDELSPSYPHVKFVMFDTGKGKRVRMKSHILERD